MKYLNRSSYLIFSLKNAILNPIAKCFRFKMKLRTLDQADVKDKRVLVRCGFDVPFTDDGKIEDDERIRECIQTLRFLMGKGAKVIIASHNGRPKGRVVEKLSMNLISAHLSELLDENVVTLTDCIGPAVKNAIDQSNPTDVILLENLRFHAEEEANDPEFAKELASLADVYVNEAFANLHRDHASMTGVPKLLPAYAGFRVQKEVDMLSQITDNPVHPFVAIIGGAKISDKIQVIKRMLEIGDYVLLGGALANTMLKAQGVSVGKSLVEDEMMHIVNDLTLTDNRLRVPVDVVTAKEIKSGVQTHKKAVANVFDDEYILDIGADTINLYEMILRQAKTIVWGGPMGYFEVKPFDHGTCEIARIIGQCDARSVAGGGDTLDALAKSGYKDKLTFTSTGGGAMLTFLEGNNMPALELLKQK